MSNDFPQIFYSWKVLASNVFVKQMDRSAFHHHGTGIPKGMRKYFQFEATAKGTSKAIKLQYANVQYQARIENDNQEGFRTRLFWGSDLAHTIKEIMPGWYEYFENEEVVKDSAPKMRLEKLPDGDSIYAIDFIEINQIENDIKSEAAEENVTYAEGSITYYYGKRYERNPENRKRAIEFHGSTCKVCGFNFEMQYGERGRGFIEIHHIKPLSAVKEEVEINPEADLVPLCANCHRMIHRNKDDVLTVEELKNIIRADAK